MVNTDKEYERISNFNYLSNIYLNDNVNINLCKTSILSKWIQFYVFIFVDPIRLSR